MGPSSSNTKKRGVANEAEEVQDGLKRRSCSPSPLPAGSGHESAQSAGELIRRLKESFMAKKVQELRLEIEKRMPHSIDNSLSDEEYETQATEIAVGLVEERKVKWESEFRQSVINELDGIAKLQCKPLPPTPRKYKLRLCNKIKDIMYHGDKIKAIDNKVLRIEICDAYSNAIISNDPISSAMVEIFLKEVGSETPISREKTMELISFDHLQFRLQHGIGYVEGLVVKSSKYWKSNKFVLGVKVIDELMLMEIGTIEEASSESFKVLTKRSEGNAKHVIPKMASEVWRLHGISRYGAYSKTLYKELGIKTVGDFLRKYYHELGPSVVKEIVGKSIPKLDGWDDIVKHAKTCEDYDPTKYDQTFNDDDHHADSNQNSGVHNRQNTSVEDNNDNWMGVGLQVNSNQNLEVLNHQNQSAETLFIHKHDNNDNLIGVSEEVSFSQNLKDFNHQNQSVKDNNINLVRTDVQVNSDQNLNLDQIRTNLEETNYPKEDSEVSENAKLPRIGSANQQWFLDNINLDNLLDSPSNGILESPNPYGIDHRVEQSQKLGP